VAHNAALIVLAFAIWIVAFWREVLKFAVYITATAVITGLAYGAIVAWRDMHQFVR